MEYESGDSSLTYRYTYGLHKNSAVIYGIPNGAGSIAQNYEYPSGTERIVKLYYHHDRLGSTAYLTDNVAGAVASFTGYDDYGAPTMKTIIRLGSRELDLACEYTGHPYDPILGVYYARARMYDASSRRFLAVDQVRGSILNPITLARYTYCFDNPLYWVDLNGMAAMSTRNIMVTDTGGFEDRPRTTPPRLGAPTNEPGQS